jgi:GAF domain-containing protein
MVELEGRRIGALVHDDSLREEEPELVDSVAATVALALDNERLEAELRAQYDFLTTIVDTAPSLLTSIDPEGGSATSIRRPSRRAATTARRRCAAALLGRLSSTGASARP